jgi:hypothetical protein
MTRYDKIIQLKKLEEQATPPEWKTDSTGGGRGMDAPHTNGIWAKEWLSRSPTLDDMRLVAALRNAAPWLLAIASCFRAGDAEQLAGLLRATDPIHDPVCDVLHRMQEAARILEATE